MTKDCLTQVSEEFKEYKANRKYRELIVPIYEVELAEQYLKIWPGEVIRCKDCKHWVGGGIDDKDNFIPPKCTYYGKPKHANGFCDEAKPKETEEKDGD